MYKRIGTKILIFTVIFICGCSPKPVITGYIEGRYTYLSTQTSGRLLQLFVRRGQWIRAGAPLFILETDPQYSAYKQAEAQVAEAKASLKDLLKGKRPTELETIEAQYRQELAVYKLAQITVSRYQKLYEQKFIQKETLDQAISQKHQSLARLDEISKQLATAKLQARIDEIAAAEARLTQAQATLKQATWTLQQKQIVSPREGLVFDLYYRVGEVIAANQPVISLLTQDNIYAVFFVPEETLSLLHARDPVDIECDSCKQKIRAYIRFISPEAEFTPPVIYSERTRTKLVYRIEAYFDNPAQTILLHPGQPITVQLARNNKP